MNVEPHADIRMAATIAFQFFQAYVDAGFTDEQAFALTRDALGKDYGEQD